MDHLHNLDTGILDALENQVFSNRKAAIAGAQLFAATACLGKIPKQPKMVYQ